MGLAIRQTTTFRFLARSLKLAVDTARLSAYRLCRQPFWGLLALFLAVIPKPAFAADALAYPPELQRALQSALEKKGPHYKPRTEHLLENGQPRFTNRLILEDSPYLVQHAHNPVNWFPWGKEAFEKAKRENKPVFLSIGYSTCHWCHVMERESFDNTGVADILNKHYVAIKVDRERRPDVDATYMAAVMILNGRGGWPMSSFLTQDGKTFFGGTYIPRDPFIQLLQDISNAWRERREEVELQAGRITAVVAEINAARGKAAKVNDKTIQKAVNAILGRYDDLQGGFSEAPKFPNEPSLLLLLDAALRSDDKRILAPLEHSLNAMAQGGLYDQVGGGFHRYATDPGWRVPHFEKMLYNQAHLARAYLLAFRLTGDPLYARIVRQTLDYVLREMRSGKGGFYSATDADSEGAEGRYFIWTKEQLNRVLDKKDAALATDLFGVSEAGNFEDSNILYLPVALDEYAKQKNQPLDNVLGRVDTIRERLRQAREQREHPFLDQKIITAWNGMLITTLTMAGDLLKNAHYLEAAELAANLLWTENRRGDGRLWRSSLNATASVEASQEDYAYFAEALLALYDTTGERRWLNRAEAIADRMLKHYWDEQNGGFFMATSASDVPIMVRPKDGFDSTTPSGNAVAVRVLARLARRTGNFDYEEKAHATIAAFSEQIVASPAAYSYMLLGVGDLMQGETGRRQYVKQGAVSVAASVYETGNTQWLGVDFKIKPGWHVNANKPLQKDLIPTAMRLADDANSWKMAPVVYPKPKITTLGFQKQQLALYDGDFQLRANIVRNNEKAVILPLDITLQACNDQLCLPPEILRLKLSRALFQ